MKQILGVMVMVLGLMGLLSACQMASDDSDREFIVETGPEDVYNESSGLVPGDDLESGTDESVADSDPLTQTRPEPTPEATPEVVIDPLDAYIDQMTLEEKIGQLLFVDVYTLNNQSETLVMTDTLRDNLARYHVGGIIFFGSNIESPDQTIDFIRSLQEASATPLFIGVDEEGGIVRRIGHKTAMGMSDVPTAIDIGASGDTTYAYDLAYTMGSEMKALGFNMDFAPVADVNTNPDNPIIGDRSFGQDPEAVGEMVVAFASGLQDAGIIATAKHFPGHGDTSSDTHTGDVYVDHDIERLQEVELIPFQKAIDAGIACIMTAHIILEKVTGTTEPATYSKAILQDLLREDMAYEGLLITDALNMDAIDQRYEPSQVGIRAFEAGNDLLLMPDDIQVVYEGLLEAFQSGRLDEEVLNIRLKRILYYKHMYHILELEENK